MTRDLSISIGEPTGLASVTVTDDMLDTYLQAVGLSSALLPRHPDDAARRALPPDLVPKLTMNKLHAYFVVRRIGNALRTKHEMEFVRPIYVDTAVSATCRIADIYESKGRLRVVFEATYDDGGTSPCLIDWRTITVLDPAVLAQVRAGDGA